MDRSRSLKSLILGFRKPLPWIAAAGFIAYAVWMILPSRLFRDPFCPVLYDESGVLLEARIAADQQWRFPQRDAPLPKKFILALLHFEDKRFLFHPGFDPLALGRAFVQNLKTGRITSGGSTITMQVVRLSRKNPRRTYLEKAGELFRALKLEFHHSKKEILKLYCNHAPFGGNIVGLESASWFYFGRSPQSLSWAEAAFLAVLPNDPGLVRNHRGRDLIEEKRNRLLELLRLRRVITPLEQRLALAEPIPETLHPLPRAAGHLLETLIVRHPGRFLFESTLSRRTQEKAAMLCEEWGRRLETQGIHNTAALVIDNSRREVVAYIGNTGAERRGEFGQAIDMIQASRSTGSILKPFLYAAMLKSGEITPLSLVSDTPVHYVGFMPENYDREFRGAVPARQALAQSLNIPAVRMLQQYGVLRFQHFLKRCGLTTLHRPASQYGLTLILGGAEAKLSELVSMYSGLAVLARNDGREVTTVRILKGEKVSESPMIHVGPGAAFLTLRALLQVSRPDEAGYWRNFSSSRAVAWKTGTSYGLRDAWAVGVTPRYTVGVWAGNADGEGKAGLTGLSAAAPLMFDLFNSLEHGGWFRRRSEFLKKVRVCRQSGFLATDLCEGIDIDMPVESQVTRTCPYHRLVHLDSTGTYRVDSRCADVSSMRHLPWFVLPPVQEFYYQKYHAEYRRLPPLHPDCLGKTSDTEPAMGLAYPARNTSVYIPVDLDGNPGSVVFQAFDRRDGAVIYWHLDDSYIGSTRTFHQMAVRPEPGKHLLILIDDEGNRLERPFTVLGKSGD